MTVLTASTVRKYTVSGTVAPVGFEDAVFFSEAEAARLSPRIDSLVALGPADAVGPPSATGPRSSPARTGTRPTPARPRTARPWTTRSRWYR
ncbi:hypothetical protein LV779_13670 [Streptomyces thinghirensis]|nr:hypothetical protein [Streptomyces thinghirensis]